MAVPICGKKRRCMKLLRSRLPLQLTIYGENKYYLVDKIGSSCGTSGKAGFCLLGELHWRNFRVITLGICTG